MKVLFTSDTHFGHKNIIKYCNRPYKTVEEMDEALIKNWNDKVNHEDIVYHLGDFAFASPNKYIHRLNGEIRLLFGNHDNQQWWHDHSNLVRVLGHYYELKLDGEMIILCHYAMRVWNKSHHGALMLYGHSHNTLPGNDQSVDVGVDSFNYAPVTLSEIRNRLRTLPKYQLPDHHSKRTNP